MRERKKKQHKVVIIASAHSRHARTLGKHHAHTRDLLASHTRPQQPHSSAATSARKKQQQHDDDAAGPTNRFTKFLQQAGLKRVDSVRRPDGWAADRVNRAMRRYFMMQLMSANRVPKYISAQSKKLFDECCRCKPLANGPSMSVEDGVLQLGGPDLPKIVRILRSKKNAGIDLLQPHTVDKCVSMSHTAAMSSLERSTERHSDH